MGDSHPTSPKCTTFMDRGHVPDFYARPAQRTRTLHPSSSGSPFLVGELCS
jgi:hypothetical protein